MIVIVLTGRCASERSFRGSSLIEAQEKSPEKKGVAGPSGLIHVVEWAWRYAPGTASLSAGAAALMAVGLLGERTGLGAGKIDQLGGAVLALGFAGAVLSGLSGGRRPNIQSQFVSWAVAICVAVTMVLVLLSAFSSVLPQGSLFLARVLRWTELVPVADRLLPITRDTRLESLGALVEPVVGEGDLISRAKALADRGTLRVENGAKLVLSSGEARTLAVHTLELQGGTIATNGADLTIEVINLRSNGGRVVSFDSRAQAPEGNRARDGGRVV